MPDSPAMSDKWAIILVSGVLSFLMSVGLAWSNDPDNFGQKVLVGWVALWPFLVLLSKIESWFENRLERSRAKIDEGANTMFASVRIPGGRWRGGVFTIDALTTRVVSRRRKHPRFETYLIGTRSEAGLTPVVATSRRLFDSDMR